MTILEAVKQVLENSIDGMTSKEITETIQKEKLYDFHAVNPHSVVNSIIRRHCQGLVFPSASTIKYFFINPKKSGKKPYYQLITREIEDYSNEITLTEDNSDVLPEEQIQEYYKLHLQQLQKQLMEQIMNNPPIFFEHLVVNLLLKLGYGYNIDSGKVIGKPYDGGIDGVINEDALGLDKIYIQAKRYSKNQSISANEVRSFGGAMMNGIKKGVFITTSHFTPAAIKFVSEQSEKSISLIDGELLTELMIKYKVGVRTIESLEILAIDTDFFNT